MEDRQMLLIALGHLCNGHYAEARELLKKLSDAWYPAPSAEERVKAAEAEMAPAPKVSKTVGF